MLNGVQGPNARLWKEPAVYEPAWSEKRIQMSRMLWVARQPPAGISGGASIHGGLAINSRPSMSRPGLAGSRAWGSTPIAFARWPGHPKTAQRMITMMTCLLFMAAPPGLIAE